MTGPYIRISVIEVDGRMVPVITVEPDPREPVVGPDPRKEADE